MPLLYVIIGVALLLILMIALKLNGVLSLVIVALAVGLMEGIPLNKVVTSMTNGIGSTLGSLALVLGFGAVLGKLMADSGAAQRIADTLIDKFGKKRIQWAMMLTGLIAGLAMFYEIGFVVLIPLAFSVAVAADVPLLYVGVPMAAALSVTHGFLPPHPGPTAIAGIYKADIGQTLLLGLVIAIPTVIVAGPLFAKILQKRGMMKPGRPNKVFQAEAIAEEDIPSFGVSVFTGLVPVLLMAISAVTSMALPKTSGLRIFCNFLGDPSIAMLISVLVAIFTCGLARKKKIADVMKTMAESISSIAMILLIIGAGGGFKQVLVDSGVGNYLAGIMQTTHLSPLVLAWLIAAILRIALGSATVAGMTAAGIVAPMIGAAAGVNPALLVLATGAGSLIFSHVNDPGFWMFKEYFNLSIPETIKSWSVLETIISVMGLAGVMILSTVVA